MNPREAMPLMAAVELGPIAEAVVRSSGEAVVVLDITGRILVFSPAAERLFGWTGADDAGARHPAGRGKASDSRERPKGPDDDPEFLHALEAAIRRNPPVS